VTSTPPDSNDTLEQERVRKEEAFAIRTEGDLRKAGGETIPLNALRVVMPGNRTPLVPQEADRRVRFAQHLLELAEGAILDQARLVSDPFESEPTTSGREAVSAGACAACRGNCCRVGGDHAYLTEETILRSWRAHPDWTLSRILDSYLERLPAESVVNSCIYHAETGCGLPRALRSSTCNRYLCAKVTTLRGSIPENSPPPVLAVMFDHGNWTRTALIDESGVKILAEASPGEGDPAA
jgi:hypothetical protein